MRTSLINKGSAYFFGKSGYRSLKHRGVVQSYIVVHIGEQLMAAYLNIRIFFVKKIL
jgi:hypothetical protein